MSYRQHPDYGKCESCLWGDEDVNQHPCNECNIAEPVWTKFSVSEAWKGRAERGEDWKKERPDGQEHPKGESKMENKNNRPTSEQSVHLTNALEHFNHELFNGILPMHKVMAVFTRNPHIIGGYFSPDKWEDDDGNPVHEIAINSNIMLNQNPVEVFGIIVHELMHFWQWELGKPTRNGYHNKEWCLYAEEIGLECYDTQGDRTVSSQNVHTKIAKDGLTEAAIAEMEEGMYLPYTALPEPDNTPVPQGGGGGGRKKDDDKPRKKRAGTRSKYTCSFCGLNVWAKTGVMIQCLQPDCSGNTVLIEAT